MSLTHELSRKDGPVLAFFLQRLGNVDPIRKDFLSKLRVLPAPLRPQGAVHYGTIGMAVDYRIRYYFGVSDNRDLTAAYGWRHFMSGRTVEAADARARTVKEFLSSLDSTLTQHMPLDRRLSEEAEEQLCRHCYVLALFEQIYRAGPSVHSPLGGLSQDATVDDLLKLPSDAAVADLRQMSWSFYDAHRDLLALPTVLNPEFAGSDEIRGADADLIVDGCLVELKASLDPKKLSPHWPAWLYQLLGYVLLDYEDEYAINSVGLCLVRQKSLLSWSIDDLIKTLSLDDEMALSELRDSFRQVVRAL